MWLDGVMFDQKVDEEWLHPVTLQTLEILLKIITCQNLPHLHFDFVIISLLIPLEKFSPVSTYCSRDIFLVGDHPTSPLFLVLLNIVHPVIEPFTFHHSVFIFMVQVYIYIIYSTLFMLLWYHLTETSPVPQGPHGEPQIIFLLFSQILPPCA